MREMLSETMLEGLFCWTCRSRTTSSGLSNLLFFSPFILPMIVDVGNPVLMEFIRVKVLDEDASGVPLSNESTEGVVVEPDLEEAVLEDVFQLAQGVVLEHR